MMARPWRLGDAAAPADTSLTIFGCPKAFTGHTAVIQRNAIQSWCALRPGCQIVLVGDDTGVADVAREFGIDHQPVVLRNAAGTPRIDSIFQRAIELARGSYVCYVNSDIILPSNFPQAIMSARASVGPCLVLGRRIDLDVVAPIDFNKEWEAELATAIRGRGSLHGYSGLDYFAFPKGAITDIPAFAVGRPGWDNWLVYRAKVLHLPVVDATAVVNAVHQNHDYSHHPQGRAGVWAGAEATANFDLMGGTLKGYSRAYTGRDADYRLIPHGIRANKRSYRLYRSFVRSSERFAFMRPVVRVVQRARGLWTSSVKLLHTGRRGSKS